jgi:Helix-turn-helix
MLDFRVVRIENSGEITKWMSERHYSGSAPRNTKYAFELKRNEQRVGLILFGSPSRQQAIKKYAGYIELTRLWVDDSCPKNTESYLIGHCLRWLKKNTDLNGVISYADPNVGHQGVIYRASNFELDGVTNPGYHYVTKDGQRVHIRQVWGRAQQKAKIVPGWNESQQADLEGLHKIPDKNGKNRFIFHFKKYVTRQKDNDKDIKLLSFFSTQTRESMWVLGLLVGDGNVFSGNGDNRISIVGNEDTITKVSKLIPGSVSKLKGKNKKVREWYVYSKSLLGFFSERNLIGKKKFIQNLYPEVSKKFKWDFLRGLIDSDGSFIWSKANGHVALNLGFSSANKSFCERVLLELRDQSEASVIASKKGNFEIFSFKLPQEESIKILDRIYDCPEKIRNDERYKKYLIGKKLLHDWMSRTCSVCGAKSVDREFCFVHLMEQKRIERRSTHKCSFEGCVKPYHGAGFCMEHFWNQRNNNNPLRNPEIGKRVKELRGQRGMSQLAMGRDVLGQKGQGHLSNVENGVSFLSEENIEKIVACFNVSKHWLIFGEE